VTCLTQFLDSFLPNVAATLVGVAAGIPIGLRVNRSLLQQQDEKARQERQARLRQALDWLLKAGERNREMLVEARDHMKAGQYMTGLPLDLSAWDSLREVIAAELPSLDLRLRLARFFEELALFGAHAERLVTALFTPDPTPDKMNHFQAQTLLGGPLLPFAERLVVDLEKLQADLLQEQRKLGL